MEVDVKAVAEELNKWRKKEANKFDVVWFSKRGYKKQLEILNQAGLVDFKEIAEFYSLIPE